MTKRKGNTKGKTQLTRAHGGKIINAVALVLGRKITDPGLGNISGKARIFRVL